jgi:hypothetical protein
MEQKQQREFPLFFFRENPDKIDFLLVLNEKMEKLGFIFRGYFILFYVKFS